MQISYSTKKYEIWLPTDNVIAIKMCAPFMADMHGTTTVLFIRNWRTLVHRRRQTLLVYSPGGNTFLSVK